MAFLSALEFAAVRAHNAGMTSKTPKRPRDLNQWAKRMLDIATGEAGDAASTPADEGKDPAAVALGRRGGLKGGKARAASMTPERRAEVARAAAQKRWGKKLNH